MIYVPKTGGQFLPAKTKKTRSGADIFKASALFLVLLIVLSGCGKKNNDEKDSREGKDPEVTLTSPAIEPTGSVAPTDNTKPTDDAAPTGTEKPTGDITPAVTAEPTKAAVPTDAQKPTGSESDKVSPTAEPTKKPQGSPTGEASVIPTSSAEYEEALIREAAEKGIGSMTKNGSHSVEDFVRFTTVDFLYYSGFGEMSSDKAIINQLTESGNWTDVYEVDAADIKIESLTENPSMPDELNELLKSGFVEEILGIEESLNFSEDYKIDKAHSVTFSYTDPDGDKGQEDIYVLRVNGRWKLDICISQLIEMYKTYQDAGF